MRRVRGLGAALLMIFVSGLSIVPPALAAPECSPGQHGNPKPGFKPGACK